MTDLSRHLGKNHAYIQQYLERGIPRTLGEVERKKVASYLSIDESLLLPTDLHNIKNQSESSLQPKIVKRMDDASFGPDTVPVLANFNGLSEVFMPDFGFPIAVALRHPNQRGIKEAYASPANDDNMSPRYIRGELVYWNRSQFPAKEQDCYIETRTGWLLGCYVKRTATEIVYRQYNPLKELKHKLADVLALHAIVGRG